MLALWLSPDSSRMCPASCPRHGKLMKDWILMHFFPALSVFKVNISSLHCFWLILFLGIMLSSGHFQKVPNRLAVRQNGIIIVPLNVKILYSLHVFSHVIETTWCSFHLVQLSKSFSSEKLPSGSVSKSADFRSLHWRRGLRLMGGAAGFHDSQDPWGHSYTSLGGQREQWRQLPLW